MTTPTQEQIKADVVSLFPGMIGCTSFDLYYWIDTGRPITPREWLMVAHEAEKTLSNNDYIGGDESSRTHYFNSIQKNSDADLRLEKIHRVCFPEKWRGEA